MQVALLVEYLYLTWAVLQTAPGALLYSFSQFVCSPLSASSLLQPDVPLIESLVQQALLSPCHLRHHAPAGLGAHAVTSVDATHNITAVLAAGVAQVSASAATRLLPLLLQAVEQHLASFDASRGVWMPGGMSQEAAVRLVAGSFDAVTVHLSTQGASGQLGHLTKNSALSSVFCSFSPRPSHVLFAAGRTVALLKLGNGCVLARGPGRATIPAPLGMGSTLKPLLRMSLPRTRGAVVRVAVPTWQ